MKIDPYKHKEKYEKWRAKAKTKGMVEVSKKNSDLILQYLDDMYYGLNVSTSRTKDGRGPARLNTLRGKMIFFSEKLKEFYNCKIDYVVDVNEIQLDKLFSMMRERWILTKRGKRFISTGDIC